jgi:hypothetical protein
MIKHELNAGIKRSDYRNNKITQTMEKGKNADKGRRLRLRMSVLASGGCESSLVVLTRGLVNECVMSDGGRVPDFWGSTKQCGALGGGGGPLESLLPCRKSAPNA